MLSSGAQPPVTRSPPFHMCTNCPVILVLLINVPFLCLSGAHHWVPFSMCLGPTVVSGMLSILEVTVSSLAQEAPDLSSSVTQHPVSLVCAQVPGQVLRRLIPRKGAVG